MRAHSAVHCCALRMLLPCMYVTCSTVDVIEMDVRPSVAIGDLPHVLGKHELVDVSGVVAQVGDKVSAAWCIYDALGVEW